MKIYVDKNYNIISIDNEPDNYFMVDENMTNYKDSHFYGICDFPLSLWKHEPQYEIILDDNKNPVIDEYGNFKYKLDSNGNKIQIGWVTYPSEKIELIDLLQRQCVFQEKQSEKQLQSIIDNDYRLSLMEMNLK